MKRFFQKTMFITFFYVTGRANAQVNINWNDINLAAAEAKIIAVIPPADPGPLNIQSFETREGKITVFLPPLSSGATISGTVYLEPDGRTEKERGANLTVLKQAYNLTLDNLNVPVQSNSFQLQIPTTQGSSVPLRLTTSGGQLIKSEQLQLTSLPSSAIRISIPPYVVSGDVTALPGNFDGSSKTTSLKINGENITVIAESPAALYFNAPATQTGPSTIECSDKGKTKTARINVVSLGLSAEKTNLRRGQQTQIHIKVTGLEGINEKVPLTIENRSPAVITLEGGNNQRVTILPADTQEGVYNTTRNIQSLITGGFSVTVLILPYQHQTGKK